MFEISQTSYKFPHPIFRKLRSMRARASHSISQISRNSSHTSQASHFQFRKLRTSFAHVQASHIFPFHILFPLCTFQTISPPSYICNFRKFLICIPWNHTSQVSQLSQSHMQISMLSQSNFRNCRYCRCKLSQLRRFPMLRRFHTCMHAVPMANIANFIYITYMFAIFPHALHASRTSHLYLAQFSSNVYIYIQHFAIFLHFAYNCNVKYKYIYIHVYIYYKKANFMC